LQTISYSTGEKITVHATFWKSEAKVKKPTIFYIHGGGLIYGNRNDLPAPYVKLLLESGYSLFSIDYCLAPECSYSAIIQSVNDGLKFFLMNSKKLGLLNNDYILFGRSAGAYLCLQLMTENLSQKPKAFVDFYGFESLLSTNLQKKNSMYASYPKVTFEEAQSMISTSPVTSSSVEERFLLYVYARQSSQWQKMIFKETQSKEKQLSKSTLQNFPPTYMCQSSSDPDVPFINSIMLKAKLPNSKLIPINSKEHDFDREVNETNLDCYRKLISWLDAVTEH
jgi:acetyl esterase/lipase